MEDRISQTYHFINSIHLQLRATEEKARDVDSFKKDRMKRDGLLHSSSFFGIDPGMECVVSFISSAPSTAVTNGQGPEIAR